MVNETPTESIELDIDIVDPVPEEIDNEDGTTSILIDGNERATDKDWFDNLAATLPASILDDLGSKYLDLIGEDKEAREDRDKMQAAGLEKSGIAGPAPGGADFEGASRVTHPLLAEAYIDFSANSIKELFPPNGPVRTKIEGKPNREKLKKAERKAAFMNWQLTQQIKSYRSELERLLTQLPVGGSQYMKIYWDEDRRRPNAEFVPIDNIVLPYHANNFYDVQRKFHMMSVSDLDYERRVTSGVYIDEALPPTTSEGMDETQSARVTARIEGKRNDYSSETGERVIYEGCVYDVIDADKKAPGNRAVPYLISIDEASGKVLSLYRNWDEDSETQEELQYLVDFNFIPWRGVFALSLLQCMAGIPDSLTGALRALLDSALISNLQGGLKLKGNPGGASLSIAPTQVTEVDAMGQDDIRKVYMPIPFNQPSPMLFQLLGFLTQEGKGVVSTAEESIAEAGNNMPVGTALALIEQGSKVFSAIHARLHDSQRRCLEILHRLNRDHIDKKLQFGNDADDFVTAEDFEGFMDIVPVSDPNIFSETQRFAQIQFVMQSLTQTAAVMPQVTSLFDMRALFARAFEMAKIPDFEKFLPKVPEAEPLNPADENVSMVMGKPVKAYEGQNHEAHIQVLLDFAQNPLFGANPIIAGKFMTAAMNHLMDHILVWYQEMMKASAAQMIDSAPDAIQWDEDPQASIELAKSAPIVDKAAQLAFAKIPDLIAKGMQQLQAMAPKPPVDPMIEVAKMQVQGKQQTDAAKVQIDGKKAQDDKEIRLAEINLEAKRLEAEIQADNAKMISENLNELEIAELKSKTELAQTIHDNTSQQHIEAMKLTNQLNPHDIPPAVPVMPHIKP